MLEKVEEAVDPSKKAVLLLKHLFTRQEFATSSVTGKSPKQSTKEEATEKKAAKKALDPNRMSFIKGNCLLLP